MNAVTSADGTLLPSAKAASCPQLAEGDIQALAERSGFDPNCDMGWIEMPQRSSHLPYPRRAILSVESTGGIRQ